MYTYKTSLFRRETVCKKIGSLSSFSLRKRIEQIWKVVSYLGAVYNMSRRLQLDLAAECVVYSYDLESMPAPSSYEEIHLMVTQYVEFYNEIDETTACLCF